MMRHGRLIISGLFCIFTSSCGGASHSGWKNLPVTISADQSIVNSPQAMSDLQAAFHFWEQRAGKVIFNFQGQWSGGTPYVGDPTKPSSIIGNVIFFQNPWPYDSTYVGMTTVENGSSGISAAMVMINGATNFCSGDCLFDPRTSGRKTFTHELGHFIGLAHSADPGDIMYPRATATGLLDQMNVDLATLRTLTQGQ